MDTTLNMKQEHALIDVKGHDTLDYITIRMATRLWTVMIFLSFSTCYVTSRILHPVSSSSLQKRCLQTGGSSGEGTESVRTEVHILCREIWRAGLGQPGAEKALGEPAVWKSLVRKILSLEVFRTWLDKVLSNLLCIEQMFD